MQEFTLQPIFVDDTQILQFYRISRLTRFFFDIIKVALVLTVTILITNWKFNKPEIRF